MSKLIQYYPTEYIHAHYGEKLTLDNLKEVLGEGEILSIELNGYRLHLPDTHAPLEPGMLVTYQGSAIGLKTIRITEKTRLIETFQSWKTDSVKVTIHGLGMRIKNGSSGSIVANDEITFTLTADGNWGTNFVPKFSNFNSANASIQKYCFTSFIGDGTSLWFNNCAVSNQGVLYRGYSPIVKYGSIYLTGGTPSAYTPWKTATGTAACVPVYCNNPGKNGMMVNGTADSSFHVLNSSGVNQFDHYFSSDMILSDNWVVLQNGSIAFRTPMMFVHSCNHVRDRTPSEILSGKFFVTNVNNHMGIPTVFALDPEYWED